MGVVRAIVLSTLLALTACGGLASQLADEIQAATESVPLPQVAGEGPAYDADVRSACADVAERWFPVGLPAAKAEQILVDQHFKITRAPGGFIWGERSRCGPIRCAGARVDLTLVGDKVGSASVMTTHGNLFSS